MCKNIFAAVIVSVLFTFSAQAASNSEILESMSGKELGAYTGASVEMIAFMAYMNGNKSVYQCILNWQYGEENGAAQLVQTMDRFPDKTPQSVLFTLVKMKCGDPRGSRK